MAEAVSATVPRSRPAACSTTIRARASASTSGATGRGAWKCFAGAVVGMSWISSHDIAACRPDACRNYPARLARAPELTQPCTSRIRWFTGLLPRLGAVRAGLHDRTCGELREVAGAWARFREWLRTHHLIGLFRPVAFPVAHPQTGESYVRTSESSTPDDGTEHVSWFYAPGGPASRSSSARSRRPRRYGRSRASRPLRRPVPRGWHAAADACPASRQWPPEAPRTPSTSPACPERGELVLSRKTI